MFAVSCVFCLLLAEIAIRVATPFPITARSHKADHPKLGYVVSSDIPDVDARGFRNNGVTLEDAEIVVVGDSHAYGYNVPANESFPAILARMTGRRVYNMGIPSYGIYHYQVLFEELETAPIREVVLALYPANDLALYCSITGLPYWREYARATGLSTPVCEDRAASSGRGTRRQQSVVAYSASLVRRNSAIANAFDHFVWNRIKPQPSFLFAHDQRVSIRRVQKHVSSTRLEGSLAERFADSLVILENANTKFKNRQIGFSVLVIPSQERVLFEWARKSGQSVDHGFESMVESQIQLTVAYLDFFENEKINYLDATDHVTSVFDTEIEGGGALYAPYDEGHPLERGYAAYAEAAVELLASAR